MRIIFGEEWAFGSGLLSRERILHATVLTLLATLAWVVMIYASLGSSWAQPLDHHARLGSSAYPLAMAIPLFLAAWVVMSAGMMLPTVWPVLDRFTQAARLQALTTLVAMMGLFIGGYLAVWGFFGVVAFAGDLILHRVVEAVRPAEAVLQLIAPGVLLLAGTFQFSRLKMACLYQCQSPVGFLLRYWRPGLLGALTLGLRHGLFCLGCCWALMLLMFGVGITNLAWMLGLTIVMYVEKVVARGPAFSRATGILLVVVAGTMFYGVLS